jgi:uncharacterized protein YbbK (DUF523 family)
LVLVSACLMGFRCRYDGAARPLHSFPEQVSGQELLPVCPEELGGLPTPRVPAEIVGGNGGDVLDGKAKVICSDGCEVTEAYLRGAEAVVVLARRYDSRQAYLKSKSPSCGAGRICRVGEVVAGFGVAAEALRRAGLDIVEVD